MAQMQRVTHTGSDGSSFAQRIAATGYNTFPQSENVAGGYNSALDVVLAWMCSDGHHKNIMVRCISLSSGEVCSATVATWHITAALLILHYVSAQTLMYVTTPLQE
jgi:hypothetical protein